MPTSLSSSVSPQAHAPADAAPGAVLAQKLEAQRATATPPERGVGLTAITAISFSLTFVAVSVALLTGLLPPAFDAIRLPVDLGVLLLIVPLCALVFAIVAEVLRSAISDARRPAVDAAAWRPGRGEG